MNAFLPALGPTFPSYPQEWDKTRMGWLRREFSVPSGWQGKRILLHFEGIFGHAQLLVNGRQVGEHFQNSLPWEVDVTDFVKPDQPNTLLLGVRQASLFDVPGKYGKLVYAAGPPWAMELVGVWQDVYLRAVPPLRVEEAVIRPWVDQNALELILTVRNNTTEAQSFKLGGEIRPWISHSGQDMLTAPESHWTLGDTALALPATEQSVGPKRTLTFTVRVPIKDELKFWTPDTPNLYGLVFDLSQKGQTQDRYYQRFGWRQWGIKGRDVTLNGKPIQLLGDAVYIHGLPFLSRRYVWARYHTLKEVNGNAVRLHVLVRPRFYLDMADEMGIAILEESDIWASAMDYNYDVPDTWLRIGAHIDGMVERDRNHPSIFGWSICNEILSALWFKAVPREMWPPVIDNVVALADRVKALDPTRAWISSDGDGDFNGRLPAYTYHYGQPRDWVRDAPKDRPFGLGEAGSMIWGSPVVFSKYNGERSYESSEGMMEGAAIEGYYYLSEERKLAAYCSTFTFESAAFEPSPFGMKDPNQAPTKDDGVFFGPFVEGQPGMQPERLQPFSSPFNPGYDPNLPLYKVTPYYESYRAAYAPGGPAPSKWDHRTETPPPPSPPPATIRQVDFVGDQHGRLAKALESSGVLVAKDSSSASASFLVIDGATLGEAQVSTAREQMHRVLSRHGTVFVWVAPENLDHVNALLPAALSLVPDHASGLYADRKAPETASLTLASLYFHDQSDRIILKSGLAGPLVAKSRVLMESNTIMRGWFDFSVTPKNPALIACESDGGRLYVTSLMPDIRSERRLQLMRNLYGNLGVVVGASSKINDTGFDGAGYVQEALIAGSFQGERYPAILDRDFLGNEAQANPHAGDKAWERTWTVTNAMGDGNFDFFSLGIPGTEGSHARSLGNELRPEALDANGYLEQTERVSGTLPGINSVAYLSFWLYTPEATVGKPDDKSAITLELTSDDGAKIWLNQQQVYVDREIHGPGVTEVQKVLLALKAGWNHVLVKSGQLDGPWSFSAKIDSANPGLLSKLHASAEAPAAAKP
jgi:beta-galactosidase